MIVVLCVLCHSLASCIVRTLRARALAQSGGQRPAAGRASGRRAQLAAGQPWGTPTGSPWPYAGLAWAQRRAGLPAAWRAGTRAWKPWRAVAGGLRFSGPPRAFGSGPFGGSGWLGPTDGASHGARGAARHGSCDRRPSGGAAWNGGAPRSCGRPGLAADAQVGTRPRQDREVRLAARPFTWVLFFVLYSYHLLLSGACAYVLHAYLSLTEAWILIEQLCEGAGASSCWS